jgi:hypothetical protein
MKKLYFIVVLILVVSFNTTAQNLIAVQNNGAATYYPTLTLANANALDGDTIYIPGGSYDGITVTKRLHLVGVGHNPDSTSITSKTKIESLTISAGADNGSATGISFSDIYFTSNLNGYAISRCLILSITNSGGISVSNLLIKECITGSLTFGDVCTNIWFSNNIVVGYLASIKNSVIRNNIVLGSKNNGWGPTSLVSSSNDLIENNVCVMNYNTDRYDYCTNLVLNNNVNMGVNGESDSNQGKNNFLVSADLSTLFANYNVSMLDLNNIYNADFHLVPASPYINAGKDSTDIGIYGGAFPWKAGSVPFNPHFQSVQVSPNSDSHGNLSIKFKVAAQNN